MREPQDWLVVAGGAIPVFRPAVLVVPDNLPSIVKADLIHVDLQEARVVMNRVDEQIPRRLQNATGFNDPPLAPCEPFFSAVEERADAKFPIFLKAVGWVGDDQVSAAIGELLQELRCVAEMDGVVWDHFGG